MGRRKWFRRRDGEDRARVRSAHVLDQREGLLRPERLDAASYDKAPRRSPRQRLRSPHDALGPGFAGLEHLAGHDQQVRIRANGASQRGQGFFDEERLRSVEQHDRRDLSLRQPSNPRRVLH